ncbi:MAG: hypothetical protein AAF327_18345, partial [Cyanobacteria bacterium P01_A01_bin.37]
MAIQAPYISRPETDAFLEAVAHAIQHPAEAPVVFHVWGLGGVGKSRLTQKIQEFHEKDTIVASVSFGLTESIDTPIELMAKLYEQVVPRNAWSAWSGDSFGELFHLYWETIHTLKTESPTGRGAVDAEQLKAVDQLLKLGVDVAGVFLSEPSKKIASSVVDNGMQAAVATLSIKDGLQQLLQDHKATRRNKTLQELMIEPLPRLTAAFVASLRQQAETQSIVLILDTYEKVSSDLDLWLWRTLLGNQSLQPHAIRLVVAGRHNILKGEGWRKLNQDRSLVYEQPIRRFDEEQTQHYLSAIGIADAAKTQQIYRVTKGLPYYLDWIRRETEKGNEPDFSQGNEEIVSLLLQGLNDTQKRIVQYAACCRRFDRKRIQQLVERDGLDFATAADEQLNCFGWLIRRSYVELVDGRYRLDDVARDVFRLSLYQDDRDQFHQTHQCLADDAKAESEVDVPPDSTYS